MTLPYFALVLEITPPKSPGLRIWYIQWESGDQDHLDFSHVVQGTDFTPCQKYGWSEQAGNTNHCIPMKLNDFAPVDPK